MKQTKNDKSIQIRRRIKAFFGRWISARSSWWRYVKNANCDYYASQKRFIYVLTSNYHVIEKCLAMPNFEPGHGKERVEVVVGDLFKYRELGFDLQHPQYIAAMQAVQEYDQVHKKLRYKLPERLQADIDWLLKGTNIQEHHQPYVTREDFFTHLNEGFEKFARSRHSIRAYSDKNIEEKTIRKVVDLARTTPTACNRQPNKTYVVGDKEMIKQIASLQGGGRGFAENANKMFVVTSAVEPFGYSEPMETYKAGGMYVMNLLYALHAYQIGTCPLMWSGEKGRDKQLRKLIGVPDNEEIIMLVAAGYPIDTFTYVTSVRNSLEESLVMVK
jgi:nitroreductase